jgi:hypothetical protein
MNKREMVVRDERSSPVGKAAPRPWDWLWTGAEYGSGFVYLVDGEGRKIATVLGRAIAESW